MCDWLSKFNVFFFFFLTLVHLPFKRSKLYLEPKIQFQGGFVKRGRVLSLTHFVQRNIH